jgi:hypothetical protein
MFVWASGVYGILTRGYFGYVVTTKETINSCYNLSCDTPVIGRCFKTLTLEVVIGALVVISLRSEINNHSTTESPG